MPEFKDREEYEKWKADRVQEIKSGKYKPGNDKEESVSIVNKTVNEARLIGFSTVFPFSMWLVDKPWNIRWVKWFGILTVFPLLMSYIEQSYKLEFRIVVFIFAVYFACIWGILMYIVIHPDRTIRKDMAQIGIFTLLLGAPVVIMLQNMPLINCLYKITDANLILSRLTGYVLGVGLVEESIKILPIFWVYVVNRKNDSLSTITYLGCVSGFAFGIIEAVYYSILYEKGLAQGHFGVSKYLIVEFTRLITIPLLHAVWSGIIAYFIALGVQNRKFLKGLMLYGMTISIIIHGVYDTFASNVIGFLIALGTIFIFIAYIRSVEIIQNNIRLK